MSATTSTASTTDTDEGQEPRVFLASPLNPMAGEWVPAWCALAEAEKIKEEYGHEEVIITDTEGIPRGMVQQSTRLEKVENLAEAIDDHGEAFRVYCDWVDTRAGVEGAIEDFKHSYEGSGYEDLEHFARDYAERLGMIPEDNPRYFDFEALARDLDCSGWWVDNGHVFCPV